MRIPFRTQAPLTAASPALMAVAAALGPGSAADAQVPHPAGRPEAVVRLDSLAGATHPGEEDT